MNTKSALWIIGGLAVAAGIGAQFFRPNARADHANGAALYDENCASCHGADLEGAPDWQNRNPDGTMKPPPHDDSGHTWHHTDSQLFLYTKLGGAGAMASVGMTDFNSAMPAFEGVLSDAEIREILAFIKSTWSEDIRESQAEMTRLNPE